MKLNLGSGTDYRDGWTNVDIGKPTDIVHDLNEFPYPFENGAVEIILLDNVLEHLDDPHAVVGECYRILKPGGTLRIIVPYYNSGGAFNDVTHQHYFNHVSLRQLFRIEGRNIDRQDHGYKEFRIMERPSRLGKIVPKRFRRSIAQVLGDVILTLEVEAKK